MSQLEVPAYPPLVPRFLGPLGGVYAFTQGHWMMTSSSRAWTVVALTAQLVTQELALP